MNMRKKIIGGLLALTLTLSLAACTTQTPGGSSAGEDDVIKMKAILISSSSQVTTGQGNAMADYAKEQGIEFSVEYYDQNTAAEMNMIENAVTSGVDVLIVHNQSEGDCVDAINRAAEAGVKVILYATDVPGTDYTYLFTEDAYALGRQMGEMAAAWANENLVAKGLPVIAALGTYSVTPIAVNRSQGARDALLELCPGAQIVGTYEMAYKEEGLEVGENILQSNPNVNLVLGINDQSACGVYEAFSAAGRTGESVGMFGIDGTDEAMYYIAKNTMFKGSLSISANEVGVRMVQAGIDLMAGSADAPDERVIYWAAQEITPETVDNYKDVWGHLEG